MTTSPLTGLRAATSIAALTVTLAVTLTACGSSDRPTTAHDPDNAAGGTPVTHSTVASPPHATLTVTTSQEPGPGGELFTEGALPEIRLVGSDGTTYRPEKDHATTARFRGLEQGDYTLRAAQRPCDGNCGYLDPPTGRCSARVHVEGRSRASVTFVVGRHCTVSA